MLAQEEALRLRHASVGAEHVLLALLEEPDSIVRPILVGSGLTLQSVREQAENVSPREGDLKLQALPLNYSATRILELSWDVVESLGAMVVCPELIFSSLAK